MYEYMQWHKFIDTRIHQVKVFMEKDVQREFIEHEVYDAPNKTLEERIEYTKQLHQYVSYMTIHHRARWPKTKQGCYLECKWNIFCSRVQKMAWTTPQASGVRMRLMSRVAEALHRLQQPTTITELVLLHATQSRQPYRLWVLRKIIQHLTHLPNQDQRWEWLEQACGISLSKNV